jgi:hypothetical protein
MKTSFEELSGESEKGIGRKGDKLVRYSYAREQEGPL